MKIGLCSAGGGACTRPEVLGRVAQHAEIAGLESLWVSEHLVVADPQTPPSQMDPGEPILEPVTALAFTAARTSTLRLGTGVVVLPLRNPLVLAKELSTIDVVSGGRLIFGVGVGYLDREFRALGASFHQRGYRTDEYLDAMCAIWTQAHPEFQGRFFAFDGVQSHPRPVQRPHPPIVIGGWAEAAMRRAATRGSGWYPWGLDHAETASALAELRRVVRLAERDPGLGELEITVTPKEPVDLRTVRSYADLGVHRLNVQMPNDLDESELLRFIDDVGTGIVARV